MTPDITQLAQSEINDALAQLKQISEYPTPSTQYALVLRKYITSQAEALEKAQIINAAAEKLVRCKGRYHSEQNYRALAALFGVKTPDLPPLDGESRTVTVENLQESAYRAGLTAGWNLGVANNNDGFNKCLAAHAAGIKVEAE